MQIPKYKYKYNYYKPKYRKKLDASLYPATSNARERLLLNLHGHEQVEMVNTKYEIPNTKY